MQFTAAQIAMMINGKIEGDPTGAVASFGKIEEAQPGQISFLANPKYEEYLYTSGASVIIINENLVLKQAVKATLIRVADAYTAFATLLTRYQELQTQQLSGIQQPSYVASTATIGENVFIGAFAYVGEQTRIGNNVKIFPGVVIGNNVTVADNTLLHAGVKVYQDCVIGKQVTIHAGAVIGSDGFGFAPKADGSYQKVPQIGNVVIEDGVEIGANTTIDRATMGSTVIRAGVKLDNLIQIAHNVEIGCDTVIAAQTGISGSTKIGKQVMVGGQVGIVGHIHIADGTRVAAKSGISKTIRETHKSFAGSPAQEATVSLRTQAIARNLPELEKRVQELEKQLAELLNSRLSS
ncbi:UDP-3-O-(3-hydroxymyristoyl)glucosamine N-acyltransferase [Sediminibacterium soli]|uniref:UDP-3-O-(3-hydroxymyristoyl)glucosamine N-acyltransferase n=1 Tax=Sediminibacterium soli TaxID=2698829 RepID=UPI00137B5D39|nr:UDP-3-O-(3-hydroxymyristoyl)glucosamine N-acyltransferase [Sediminibacterium soli]NCI45527.1 UDP-3-O-(3-hydroxymyristoyl)glucosamine N-acyltransferase [Sediminibacterium soli]